MKKPARPVTFSFFDRHGYHVTLRRAAVESVRYDAAHDHLVISTATNDYEPDVSLIHDIDQLENDIFGDDTP
jgi:hypothetical protein